MERDRHGSSRLIALDDLLDAGRLPFSNAPPRSAIAL
jgi:hypothetical protein